MVKKEKKKNEKRKGKEDDVKAEEIRSKFVGIRPNRYRG